MLALNEKTGLLVSNPCVDDIPEGRSASGGAGEGEFGDYGWGRKGPAVESCF